MNHVELVRKARGAEMPETFWTDPLIYQGGSDAFLNPRDPIPALTEDCTASISRPKSPSSPGTCRWAPRPRRGRRCHLAGRARQRRLAAQSHPHGTGQRLRLLPVEAGLDRSRPIAVTPDELGDAWEGGKLHLPLLSSLNGSLFGRPNAGVDMTFDFPTLIAHAARTRALGAGTIIGSGTVSNKGEDGGPGQARQRGRRRLFVHRRTADHGDDPERRGKNAVSSNSATRSASR